MLFNQSDHLHNISPSQNINYRAVIENNDDSLLNNGKPTGKCQVRILGIHPENSKRSGKNKGVPTEDLPWAEVTGTSDFHGGMSGIGSSSVYLKGTWVWVFFDGGDWNKPVIFSSIIGTSTKLSPGANTTNGGFNDPDEVYPLEDRLNESDMNRLMVNRNFDKTIVKLVRDDNKDIAIPTSTGSLWNEIEEKSSSVIYPNNTVTETVGGSIVEYDSTPDNERIHFFHKSGSYWEIQNEGNYQMKIVGDKQEIINLDLRILVKKDKTETIRGDVETKIDGDETILIGGNHLETIRGNTKSNVKGDVDIVCDSSKTEKVSDSVTEKFGSLKTDGGSSIDLDASVIYLN